MLGSYYRLPAAFIASISLMLGGCGVTRTTQPDATAAELPQPAQQEASVGTQEERTDDTLWTLLHIVKKPQHDPGPQTGPGVSPVIWQAVLDTMRFADIDSTDPITGLATTKWYTPKGKPNERMRITAFVKARALRSDSIVVTVERQTRLPSGQWQDAPIAADVASTLENDILERARQIHIARLRENQ